ncbi:immune inhibitor A domain-containing protein [Bacillus spongiae]|uniref:Immune inhibitor A domain-containing protein n=1 Tax=Bacillus spongiae TaxID=2683610 RepID=A0ABU8HI37_9BACI
MKRRKFVSVAMAAALSLGAFVAPASTNAMNLTSTKIEAAKAKTAESHDQSHHSVGGPIDLGVANEERLIEMLKKSGKLATDATGEEAEKAVKDYLKEVSKKAEKQLKNDGELSEQEHKLNKEKEKLQTNAFTNGNGNKLGKAKKNAPGNLVEENYEGEVRTDEVLVLLVEFPDFKANDMNPEDTDMYYADYAKEHYEDLVFGENGYEGPNGENLISMKQYYEQQSGGAYTVDGAVAGWYEAEHPAAYYGAANGDSNDTDARSLVREALDAAAADPTIDLADFDKEDRYDLDGDGDLREPDGLVDHLMIVHSSVGQEAGGGQLGEDAIWSHRWNLGGVYGIEGTETDVSYWDGLMAAYDYTVQPADGAAGVFSHEYAHDLGLPDEYDTQYTGQGEPVSYWSLMSSGSWAGIIPGTEPTGFSAWAKEELQASMGGNWLHGGEINIEDLDGKGLEAVLDEGVSKGTNLDALRVNLPQKEQVINTPATGSYEYHSQSGHDLDNSLVTTVDLTNATSGALNFKAWYQIEQGWDFGSVQVKDGNDDWVAIQGNITTTDDPHGQNPGHGITGSSDGWVDASFDLSAYAGKEVQVKINYWTDPAAAEAGLYVDDVQVVVDGAEVLFDGAEGEAVVDLDGFVKTDGKFFSDHYYLLEWRTHNGVDEGLKHIRRGDSLMTFDDGLIVWYVDDSYDNNWTGAHPGEGFLGVVDADQKTLYWSDDSVASTRYQVHDAAFSLDKSEKMFLDYSDLLGITLTDNYTKRNPLFDDSKNYLNAGLPDAGRNVPNYGLNIRVTGQSADGKVGKVLLFKK